MTKCNILHPIRSNADTASAIVVGAGVFGAAVADALTARGWQVLIVDRWGPANARSSSGDHTRLLRCGHGPGPAGEWYTRSAWRARELWHELAEESATELLVETGVVWFATQDCQAPISEPLLRELGVPFETLSPAQLSELFPSLNVADISHGIHEKQAGVIRAAESVRALLARSRERGARLLHGTARPTGDAVNIDGEIHRADRIIWAGGAWLGTLFPAFAPVVATAQPVLYWNTPPAWRGIPAWIDIARDAYGTPDLDGMGLKALSGGTGAAIDPDRDSRLPDGGAVAQMRGFLRARFPQLGDAPVLRAYTMHYEMSPDNEFIIGPVPGSERVWIAGGGSGHGFKHGPALGEYIADALEGKAPLHPPHLLTAGRDAALARAAGGDP